MRCSAEISVGSDNSLPTEFRIFRAGVNETDYGPCLFDSVAARRVMANYIKCGHDLVIDLQHGMTDDDQRKYRADAEDARGNAKLQLRPNGELWAVSATWTPDGERRLREKTQRFTSPAFTRNRKDGRIISLFNVALVSLPGTHDAIPLVAAHKQTSARSAGLTRLSGMNPDLLAKALDCIEKGDGAAALELLKAFIADEASECADTSAVDPMAEAADPKPAIPNPNGDPADKKDAVDPNKVAATALCKLTGKASAGEAIAEFTRLQARVAEIDAAQAALDNTSRLELIGDLVKLGAELPCTAWEGEPKDRKPCKRLAGESVESLRARVVTLRAARPDGLKGNTAPEGDLFTLSADDQKRADGIKDPAAKERFIAARKAKTAGRTV